MRLCAAVRLLLVLGAVPSLAAQDDHASVTVSHATPKAIADVMGEILKPQKFKVASVNRKRITITQPRGSVAQSTGEIVRVRLDVDFTLAEQGDSTRITVASETLVGEGPSFEQRRPQDPSRNNASYQNLLTQVKARLEAPADSTHADPPRP